MIRALFFVTGLVLGSGGSWGWGPGLEAASAGFLSYLVVGALIRFLFPGPALHDRPKEGTT